MGKSLSKVMGPAIDPLRLVDKGMKGVKSILSPDMPKDVTPDPVAKESSAGSMYGAERAEQNRSGMASTKRVKSLLSQQRQTLG